VGPLDYPEVEPTTKADDVAVLIEEAIVAGELAPGTVLRQDQLAEKFGVSRTPVREALRRLVGVGLLSFTPNRGARVRSVSRQELREAFLVRAELEGLAAELAAPRVTEETLVGLRAAEEEFTELTRALRETSLSRDERHPIERNWVRANERFHDLILQAADAPLLERMARSVRRTFFGQAVWVQNTEIDRLYELNFQQHRAIREALGARSGRGARSVVADHVLDSGVLLERILDDLEKAAETRGSPTKRR
jgi:DNA-binding GntR family transcriptional regulator